MKVAILDDYQGVAQEFADWSKLNQTCDVKVFREAFEDEANAIENLKEFEALLIMRERTPIKRLLQLAHMPYDAESRRDDMLTATP